MKFNNLLESPQETFPTDFGLENETTNINLGKKLLGRDGGKTPVKRMDDGHTLWEFAREYAIIRDADSHIEYYMRFRFDEYQPLNRKCVWQVTLWRNPKRGFAAGTASAIFGDLLSKYGTVITDAEQTPDGRRFWADRIESALTTSGLHVYYIDLANPSNPVEIKTRTDYNQMINAPAYGRAASFQDRRFIITTHPF